MTQPLVTIVTPSYNQAAYLEEAMRSVLDQDYESLEYIVVDGGSTDGSVEIIRRHEDRLAWWTSEPDTGQVAALNRGFARAQGSFLGWLNSDDVLLPGAVAVVASILEEDPELLLAYGDNVFVDEAGREIAPAAAQEFDLGRMVRTAQNVVPQPGSLFRRSALQLAPLNERGYYFFDFEFAIRLGVTGRVRHVPQTLARYRFHPESKTAAEPLRKAADYVRLAEEFFGGRDFPDELRGHVRAGQTSAYVSASTFAYAGDDVGAARRYLLRALRVSRGRLPRKALGLALRSLLPRAVVARRHAPRRA